MSVLQRRGNYGKAMNYFNKTWEFYKNGFGQLEKDFWIGNNLIFTLTNQGSYSVRFDMRHHNGTSAYALYDKFWIEDEDKKYQLNIDGYSGNAGDSMSYHKAMKFSTSDNDNDQHSGNCAVMYSGAWWYKTCQQVTFNGLYRIGKYSVPGSTDGIHWYKFSDYPDSLEFTEIKIRSMYFK
ncbi:hypothetical protein JTE90_027993 [Oedothorax gibbosus]|uniref:Fibrinogen C-terminal domain-containing protein n=1 Tax=Oedothorax gibbosus TaxID=931172 RepID=A0AAV6VF30_9ARAC|nr:hypothetical protein JTE90_027993 [Oedothorax gibbosus]